MMIIIADLVLNFAKLINFIADNRQTDKMKTQLATSAHRQCGFQEARKHSCTRASVCMWTEPHPARTRIGGSRFR